MGLVFSSIGFFFILNTVRIGGRKEVALSIWMLGGFVFLLQLRFAATRYWLPFFFPVLIVILHQTKFRERLILLGTTSILSIFLMVDDYLFAKAHYDGAQKVFSEGKKGFFAGHWGWQHYLEDAGWNSVEDDMLLPKDIWFTTINSAWPQEVQGCLILKEEFSFLSFGGPRVHTYEGRANFHSSHISGLGMVFSPWSFGSDPYVDVQLFRSCP
jgi:hypothetical protein